MGIMETTLWRRGKKCPKLFQKKTLKLIKTKILGMESIPLPFDIHLKGLKSILILLTPKSERHKTLPKILGFQKLFESVFLLRM